MFVSCVSRYRRAYLSASVAMGLFVAVPLFPAAADTELDNLFGPRTSDPVDWSGVYIGAHGGYGWGDFDYVLDVEGVVEESVSHDGNGWLYGGHVGVQHQYGRIVAGLELSYSKLDVSDTVLSKIGGERYRTIDVDALFTATARIGLARDHMLWYIKGGYAAADVETAIFKGYSPKSTTSGWDSGWTIGAGVDVLCHSRFILGFEYNYVDLDVDDRTALLPDKKPFTYSDFDGESHSVVARLSYKFGHDPEPPPAPLK